ncbi:hypothetical protein [Methylophilus sp. 5]|uniref:hypothetical protein n=1 Tax=Methylophilus sp. 5 TaxID=1112274 RepID=UPI00048AB0B3|nr:hypothetical protein [Methylophilus sp. 5]
MYEQTNKYKNDLNTLIVELQHKLVSRANIAEISPHYRSQIQELIKDASQSTDWLILTKYLADLIFEGTVQDFLLNLTVKQAMNPLIIKHNAQEVELIDAKKKVSKAQSDHSKGGLNKTKNDPKQKEKQVVKECWQRWQESKVASPPYGHYRNNTKFAQDMIDKFRPDNPEDEVNHLSSVAVITGWCRQWEKEKMQSAS